MKIKKEYILLFLVIILAVFLRFYNLSYTEFKSDQALNLYLGLDLIKNNFTTNHILLSSVGTYNPPAFHYILSLPLILSKNPIFVSGFIVLLNILAIILCYFLVKKISNTKTALLAILLYAVNPWVILYSRHIWHQNILPLFVLIFIYGLVCLIKNKPRTFNQRIEARQKNYLLHSNNSTSRDRACQKVRGENGKYLILASAGLAIALQLHLSVILLILLIIIVALWQKKHIKFIHLLLSLLVFLIIFTPYFIYEINHNYYNLQKYIELSKLPWQLHPTASIMPWQLSTTLGFENYFGKNLPLLLTHPISLLILDIIYLILLIAGFIWLLLNYKKRKEYIVLILWFLLPIIFLVFNKSLIYKHYFIVLFPVQFIFLALFAAHLFNKFKKNKSAFLFLCFFVFLLIIYQLSYSFTYLNLIKKQRCFPATYGPTLQYQMDEVKKTLTTGETDLQKIFEQSCNCSEYCTPLATQYLIDYHNDSL